MGRLLEYSRPEVKLAQTRVERLWIWREGTSFRSPWKVQLTGFVWGERGMDDVNIFWPKCWEDRVWCQLRWGQQWEEQEGRMCEGMRNHWSSK